MLTVESSLKQSIHRFYFYCSTIIGFSVFEVFTPFGLSFRHEIFRISFAAFHITVNIWLHTYATWVHYTARTTENSRNCVSQSCVYEQVHNIRDEYFYDRFDRFMKYSLMKIRCVNIFCIR